MNHTFSVEIQSKIYVRHMTMSNDPPDHVFFEGNLGELEELSLIEDAVLEVRGENGVLRMDLSRGELEKLLKRKEGRNISGNEKTEGKVEDR
jgi:hypothetical protein